MKPENKKTKNRDTSAVLETPSGVNRWLAKLRKISQSFWFVPTLCIIAAAIFAESTLAIDRWPLAHEAFSGFGWLSDVGVDGARSMLSAIGTAMLGVAATAFSITISVIATAASTYGPRLVRNFMSDRGNQIVLGVLCSTFIYALLIVRTIRSGDDTEPSWVPQFSVSLGIIFALLDVVMLIWFIHHISDSVQVNTIAEGVRNRWIDSVRRWFTEPGKPDLATLRDYPKPAPSIAGVPATLTLKNVGYIVEIDFDTLADIAAKADARIVVTKPVGGHVVESEPVARIWPAEALEEIEKAAQRQFTIGYSRTTYQDLHFAEQ